MLDLSEMFGNTQLITTLRKQISKANFSHSVIIGGDAGFGKKTLALAMTKELFCETQSSCNHCYSCKAITSGNHPDIVFIRPEKIKSVGVDDVREKINSDVYIKPYGRFKVYIIETADAMTVQAQNALLKTLEEAPNYAVFILCSESPQLLLPTILSRCSILKLRPVSDEDVLECLKKHGHSENLDKITKSVNGNIGRAISFASSDEFKKTDEFVIQISEKIETAELLDCFTLAKKSEEFKDNLKLMLELLLLEFCKKMHENVGSLESSTKVRAILKTIDGFNHNANFLLSMEVLFLKLSGR